MNVQQKPGTEWMNVALNPCLAEFRCLLIADRFDRTPGGLETGGEFVWRDVGLITPSSNIANSCHDLVS